MADALIETTGENPYASIVSDTQAQINDIDSKIQGIISAIAKLEQMDPTSQYLPGLRNRLAELQQKMGSLNKQSDAAKSLLNSYNDSLANTNTMQGIYQLKQAELNRAQQEADESYRRMYQDVERGRDNYLNALGNATASENAIINANAGRYGASAQSTAEARARNYLANAQAQAEYANNIQSQLNAIEENRLTSNAGYVQLSQSNADNTLRQQVMNNFEANQNATKYGSSGGGSSKSKNVTLPDTSQNQPPTEETTKGGNDGGGTTTTTTTTDNGGYHWKTFDASRTTEENNRAGVYGNIDSDVVHYHNGWSDYGQMSNGFRANIANLDRTKVKNAVEKINKESGENFDLNNADGWITNKGYVMLVNTYEDVDGPKEKIRAIPLSEVSDNDYYLNKDGKKVYFR